MNKDDKEMKQKFNVITSTCVPIELENIDTDQIVPARYLKATTREGFGDLLFRDWRYHEDGTEVKDFVLNDPKYKGEILGLEPRARGVGHSRLRVQGGHQQLLCRYPQEQRTQQLCAAGRRE